MDFGCDGETCSGHRKQPFVEKTLDCRRKPHKDSWLARNQDRIKFRVVPGRPRIGTFRTLLTELGARYVVTGSVKRAEARLSDWVRASRKPLDRLDLWDLYRRALWHFYELTGKAVCHYFLGDPVEAEKLAREAIGRWSRQTTSLLNPLTI